MTSSDQGDLKLPKKDVGPMAWSDFKQTILLGRFSGVNEAGLPRSFTMGDVLLQTFDEMLPKESGLGHALRKFQVETGRRPIGDEVGRAIITDQLGSKFMVQTRNVGVSTQTMTGINLHMTPVPGEIGNIHTHPIDVMPTGGGLREFFNRTTCCKICCFSKASICTGSTSKYYTVSGF
ncbi:hypothetical protein HY409_00560 [Candidatus Gottesmanbacteria bacterium]|nr:hypothetical protein [Candidatus Gottesmanbacteria bacterium]